MPDQFTRVTTKSYGSRIMDSIKGVIVGILLFLGSFAVLYWNEGRVDLSKIAKKSEEISSSVAARGEKNGLFVSTTGTVSSQETLGDGLYLKPGPYLAVTRKAEMYAWVEKQDSSSKENLGGSETTTTTYTYEKAWTSSPESSSSFEYPAGHENPPMSLKGGSYQVKNLSVGIYGVNGTEVTLPGGDDLAVTNDNVSVPVGGRVSGGFLYTKGDPANPLIGDERVSYQVLRKDFEGTVFGKLNGSQLSRYTDSKGNTLYRVFEGDRAAALATMHGEYQFLLWLFRLIGFLMMWGGMGMVLAPISIVLSFVPIFGSLGRTAASLVTLPIALVLSLVTIVISMILHSVIALLIVLALTVIGFGVLMQKNKSKIASMMR